MKLDDTRFRWSHGLAGMRHRVQALGGRFSIESSPAEGTTLRVELPKKPASHRLSSARWRQWLSRGAHFDWPSATMPLSSEMSRILSRK